MPLPENPIPTPVRRGGRTRVARACTKDTLAATRVVMESLRIIASNPPSESVGPHRDGDGPCGGFRYGRGRRGFDPLGVLHCTGRVEPG